MLVTGLLCSLDDRKTHRLFMRMDRGPNEPMEKKILVTAAGGNQGKILIPKLAKAGFTVRAMRRSKGADELLAIGASDVVIGDASNLLWGESANSGECRLRPCQLRQPCLRSGTSRAPRCSRSRPCGTITTRASWRRPRSIPIPVTGAI